MGITETYKKIDANTVETTQTKKTTIRKEGLLEEEARLVAAIAQAQVTLANIRTRLDLLDS